MEPGWTKRWQRSRGLPNLGFGGTLVTALISSILAARTVEAVCIVLSFGAHAYFSERVRLSDWKHSIGLLSNGQVLPGPLIFLFVPGLLVMWAAFVLLTEFIAGVLTARLKRCAPWLTHVCRCIGGLALLGFATWVYARGGFLIHPIPLSALIGGLVLLWKGAGRPLSRRVQLQGSRPPH